jgi:hypothetical protein
MIVESSVSLIKTYASCQQDISNSLYTSECLLELVKLALVNSEDDSFEGTTLLKEANLTLFKSFEIMHKLILESDAGVYKISTNEALDCTRY